MPNLKERFLDVVKGGLNLLGFVQVFGRRREVSIHALMRPATEKRQ